MSRFDSIRWLRVTLCCASLLLLAPIAEAIVVAPHHAFLDDRTRSGVIYLHNPEAEPEEVSISFVFGYPVSDSAGDVSVQLIPEPAEDAPSAADWIRAYPRRTVIGPGQTRAVRLLAQPPADLADGEYWTRALVTSRGAAAPAAASDTVGVRVGLTLEVRTVVPITYRKGAVETGVSLGNIERVVAGDSLVTRVALRRLGNAAFLGMLHVTLLDVNGNAVAGAHRHIAVYRDLLKRVSLPVKGLTAGDYVLQIRIDTQRSDLDPQVVLPAPPLQSSFPVRLP